jgi:beta-lactamase regulating signal transducer with metallopeptidase domain
MNGLASWWSPELQAVAWALVHFLWQGAVVGAVLAVALAFLSKASARARYAVALAATAALALWPLATVLGFSSLEVPPAISAAAAPAPVLDPTAASSPAAPPVTSGGLTSLAGAVEPYLPWIAAAWATGVVVLAAVHLGGLARLRRFRQGCARPLPEELQKRLAQLAGRLGVARAVGLYQSAEAAVPMVLGWLRPMIVVPASTLAGLTPQQMDAVLAHELAHVRRHDYLVNLLQTVVETLLFYHPVVWWVSSVVRRERESCCDDLAVAACGDRLGYAKALATLEELRSPSFAMAATGGSLLFRVRRIVGLPSRSTGKPWLAGLVALSIFPLGGLAELRWAVVRDDASVASPGAAPAAKDEAYRGSWRAERNKDGTIDLQMKMRRDEGNRWSYSDTFAADKLQGLTAGPEVSFRMRRGEATFLFTGRFSGKTGTGSFTLKLDPAWAKELEGMGYGRVNEGRLVELAIHDISRAWVRDIRSAGYTKTSLNKLIELHIHGVTGTFVRALTDAGYKDLPADKLIEVKIHGIAPEYIRAMGASGLRDLPVNKLIELKIHGVDPQSLRELVALGYANLPADQVIQLQIHGVTPDFVRGLADAGLRNVSAQKLIELKIHGVDGAFVRKAKERSADLSADRLIQLRIMGL